MNEMHVAGKPSNQGATSRKSLIFFLKKLEFSNNLKSR